MKPLALLLVLSAAVNADDWMPKLHPGGKLDAPWTTAGSARPDMFSLGKLLIINAAPGSWWEKANDLPYWLQRPFKLNSASIELELEFEPGPGAEQAGLALFYDSENYVKLVREFTSQHVVAFCSEKAGTGDPLLITPAKAKRLTLRLDRRGPVVTAFYQTPTSKPNIQLGACRLPASDKPLMLVIYAQGSKQRTEPAGATFFSLRVTPR